MGEDAADDSAPDGSTSTVATSIKASNAAAKKKAALWNKQAKNLKIKDVGKKIEAIEFCAHNEMFLQERDVLPQFMGFLTRVKVISFPAPCTGVSPAIPNWKLTPLLMKDARGDCGYIANI